MDHLNRVILRNECVRTPEGIHLKENQRWYKACHYDSSISTIKEFNEKVSTLERKDLSINLYIILYKESKYRSLRSNYFRSKAAKILLVTIKTVTDEQLDIIQRVEEHITKDEARIRAAYQMHYKERHTLFPFGIKPVDPTLTIKGWL
jgi:hypothetical protein